MLSLLIKAGAEVYAPNNFGYTPSHMASCIDDKWYALLTTLLKKGAMDYAHDAAGARNEYMEERIGYQWPRLLR